MLLLFILFVWCNPSFLVVDGIPSNLSVSLNIHWGVALFHGFSQMIRDSCLECVLPYQLSLSTSFAPSFLDLRWYDVYIIPILRGHRQTKMSSKTSRTFTGFVSRLCHVEKRREPGTLNKPCIKWMAMMKHCMFHSSWFRVDSNWNNHWKTRGFGKTAWIPSFQGFPGPSQILGEIFTITIGHVSNDKRPGGCLGIGDEIKLPSCVGENDNQPLYPV